ncbi:MULTISPECIES: carboxylesterase/lipase family protein [unclassified Arthrobacter]|uniref:carboxylesterase/lipase family protein n=1 Tax=unclassified Arthrobacter TaxID=235627 RepID=UPI0024E023EE|nr:MULTISPECIES: carboxylesterase/lipase family protein [unclassified Arthrobacter]MCC9145309.1 carboxylesterase/lipase family protein [Arthrobacter sp. zg-Y919]MDK1276537.1 carboxylesterase/lipase family protein [Arthrobacter sp. zg.Y919]WIB01870.1 carboxylesterase/lipase family protein [Arthrobacter sp. zg-Y919]
MAIDVASLVVETGNGLVQGIIDSGVRTWRGIPYAAPPVGGLRLRAPRPPGSWTGIRDAGSFGAVPPQSKAPSLTGTRRRVAMDEDCLTLNVSAPLEPPDGLLPVLVYLYGGAFSSGSSAEPTYRGTNLVRDGGVIYVSLNYRIGALGFMDFRAYSTPGRPFDVNMGLRDQVAALEWVQQNIEAFGGDPHNVTLFGESAGGLAVTSLMCVPSARHLFHQAYAQSPAPSAAYSPALHAAWAADLLEILGVPPADAAEALTTMPAAKLVNATRKLTTKIGPVKQPGSLSVSPVIDGGFLPRHPVDAFLAGESNPVPLVLGTMAREGALFAKISNILPSSVVRIEKMFAGTDPQARDRVVAAYPGYPSRQRSVDISGDLVFWYPSQMVAEGHSLVAPTWMYRYDYATPMMNLLGFGATHSFDVPVMFGDTETRTARALTLLGGAGEIKALSRRYQGSLLSLAWHSHPGSDWPAYDGLHRHTRVFDKLDRIVSDPFPERRLAWSGYRGYI